MTQQSTGAAGEHREHGADVAEDYRRLMQFAEDGANQTAFLRQQIGQATDAIRQLYDAVTQQCVQLHSSDSELLQELQKFQTGGPQRAMAGVFGKLFRDLLKHMNQLDELITAAESTQDSTISPSWLEALRAARSYFESILRDWGCTTIPVSIGDEFNPEIHEAVLESVASSTVGTNRIVGIRQRGWSLSGYVLQHPLVLVD